MSRSSRISRRAMLRGTSAAIALPWLEAMRPAAALAGPAAANASDTPRRMAFFYVPNGVHMPAWKPTGKGAEFELPWSLEPLKPHKDDLMVLTGLAQRNGMALGDGAGDHARALGSFLTGAHPFKTDGANIKLGVSVDQVAALAIGDQTRLPSLELGIERGAQSGNCDSGYSCAYSSNISWRSETMPMAKEINPRFVFDRLFGAAAAGSADERQKRGLYERSILDFVLEDAQSLRNRIGVNDRRKMDEYLTSVREIERRISRADAAEELAESTGAKRPKGVPGDYAEHIRLMFELIALAFQTDSTRVCTFMFANEGSSRPYPFLGVPEGHHDLSHHGNDPAKHEKLKKINRFHIEEFARLIERLKSIREGERSLLDNCMLVYGSGLCDGNRHNHDDLPILLAGKAAGAFQTGRHVVYDDLPLNNLFLSMLDVMGVPCENLGDSTGRLKGLDG